MESNLWWHCHINEIAKKANKRLTVLSYYKYKSNRNVLEMMYFLFVPPILEYFKVVWAGAHNIESN